MALTATDASLILLHCRSILVQACSALARSAVVKPLLPPLLQRFNHAENKNAACKDESQIDHRCLLLSAGTGQMLRQAARVDNPLLIILPTIYALFRAGTQRYR
ncbi:hypothetical protein [Pantoea latae]|uniref:hypothetical protein n=1 Tax=Pantoea latae TaxID=1964541 RepID=UPI001301D0E4|nr:hypothetical protein [Pantoea latae]